MKEKREIDDVRRAEAITARLRRVMNHHVLGEKLRKRISRKYHVKKNQEGSN